MHLHAYMCDRLCEGVHACVADGMASSAPACAPAWQILHLHARLHGRLCDCMHACVADSAVCACLHGRLCSCMHACVARYATAWVHVWQKALVHQYGRLCNRMCGRVCGCVRASAAANAVHACLCGIFCTCMHACVAGIACMRANVNASNYVQARVADCAIVCVRSCVGDNVVLVWPIMPLQACLSGSWCSACMPAWQIMHLHACLCATLCNCMPPCMAESTSRAQWQILAAFAPACMPVWHIQFV